MGLFGGFKAKFTKDSTRKASKGSKGSEVVCLGYRVRSEFDDLPKNTTATIRSPNVKLQNYTEGEASTSTSATNSVYRPGKKKIAPLSRPLANEDGKIHGEETIANEETASASTTATISVHRPTKKKVPPPLKEADKIHVNQGETSISTSTKNSAHKLTKNKVPSPPRPLVQEVDKTQVENSTDNVVVLNGTAVKVNNIESRPKSIYVEGKTSSFDPNPRKEIKSILKVAPPPPNNEVLNQDKNETTSESDDNDEYHSSLTFTTRSGNKDFTTTTRGAMTATRLVTENHTAEVKTFVRTEVTEHSTTVNNNNSSSNVSFGRNINHTSRQAASIFFDGDDEPEIQQRPRKLHMNTDDDRRSSADC